MSDSLNDHREENPQSDVCDRCGVDVFVDDDSPRAKGCPFWCAACAKETALTRLSRPSPAVLERKLERLGIYYPNDEV